VLVGEWLEFPQFFIAQARYAPLNCENLDSFCHQIMDIREVEP